MKFSNGIFHGFVKFPWAQRYKINNISRDPFLIQCRFRYSSKLSKIKGSKPENLSSQKNPFQQFFCADKSISLVGYRALKVSNYSSFKRTLLENVYFDDSAYSNQSQDPRPDRIEWSCGLHGRKASGFLPASEWAQADLWPELGDLKTTCFSSNSPENKANQAIMSKRPSRCIKTVKSKTVEDRLNINED